jgi:hypothetical protein
MKILRVIVEVFAYYIEKRRLITFLHAHGNAYAVDHREEWKEFSRKNWASRFLKK